MTVGQKRISYIFILVPVLTFFGFFFRYMVNAPINDDYHAVLYFLNNCISTDSYFEKLKLILAQHNEHRIIYDRILSILSYKIQRHVDFTTLALIGNLSLVGIGWILFRKFRHTGNPLILFVPVTVLLFNLAQWENMTFAMACLSNFTVFAFILLSLHWVAKNNSLTVRDILYSIFFLVLAVMTQGGGLFVIPVAAFLLLVKREFRNLAIYLSLALIVVACYFVGYEKPGQSGDLSTVISAPIEVLRYAMAFLGNAFNYFMIYTSPETSVNVTTVLGGLFFGLFIYITAKQYYKKNPFVYGIMLLIVISAFVTAYSRFSMGIETAAASRYRINGILMAIGLYFWATDSFPVQKKSVRITILTLATCYFVLINLNHYEYLSLRERQTYTGILFYKAGNPNLLNCDRRDMNFYTGIVENSKQLETYSFDQVDDLDNYFPMASKQIVNIESNTDSWLNNGIDEISELPDSYLINGWAYIDKESPSGQKVFIGIKRADEAAAYYLAKQIPRFDLNPYFKKFNLTSGGFSVRIPSKDLLPGEYSVSIMVEKNNKVKIQETDKKVKI